MSAAVANTASEPDAFSDPPLKVALIGGSGLEEAFSVTSIKEHRPETPFGAPAGPILQTTFEGVDLLILLRHGPGHLLNPSQVPSRANIFALKVLGASHVIATGAVGSLREEFAHRDLVIPDQAIDKTFRRPQTFFENAAVHVEFAEPFCPILRRILLDAVQPSNKLHDGGCYVCMEGPAFSTRAESHMHRLWGGDLIGMTLLPEAKLAREAELPYAAICMVTDYDSWRARLADAPVDPFLLLKEVLGNLREASVQAMELIRGAVRLMSQRREALARCPAREALKLGIWSDKRRIDPEEVRRLWPLWGRHFPPEMAPQA